MLLRNLVEAAVILVVSCLVAGCGKSPCEKQSEKLASCNITMKNPVTNQTCDAFNACLANCINNAACDDFATGKVAVCQGMCQQ